MTGKAQNPERAWSRRQALSGLAATAIGGWTVVGAVRPGQARAAGVVAPAGFPPHLDVYRRVFENWAGEIRTEPLWTCSPRTGQEVAEVCDWARELGWKVRPVGRRHGWSPLVVADGTRDDARVVLVDTTRHLTGMSLGPVAADGSAAVRVQAGALMEDLLEFLGERRLGVTACPAPGDLSVGGALAIGAHGTAVPAAGEPAAAGKGFGTLSNLVTELTAVVWDDAAGAYAVRSYDRADPDCAALLTHLGRAFVVEAVLRVGRDDNLRCRSYLDIPSRDLFAAPGSGVPASRTLSGFLDATGRVEAIWFAFTDRPWLKTWSVTPNRPLASRSVTEPYNYPFSDNIPEPVARLAGQVFAGSWAGAPLLGQLQYLIAKIGLTGDITDVLTSPTLIRDLLTADVITHLLAGGLRSDLWGPSRDLLLYIRPTTLRETANGYALLTRREDVQWVVHQVTGHYSGLLEEYAARGLYPVNGQVEIRVTGTDDPAVSMVPGAQPPLLSAVRARADRPDFDTAVWFDVLSDPATPGLHSFCRDMERFLFDTLDGDRATVRVEWSKGWAYTDTAAWAASDILTEAVPASHRAGGGPGWDSARDTLNRLDPHRVLTTPLLDTLLP
ncbi:cholesterol oxidase substrate-binding domain-containing protein [Streptomyces sp. SP18CS02]|uniref:cholesterol oxidase substrate-binding domain-containing protein n=1 Tax=Streptomyces sp. SP18CS02 TaxID=3002531 RepID=UPI002E774AB0|nr:cholesterol oxidase substrate-binding domain-containing protein [Streptomyces sp. SP18CS02]MEE1751427.1 cholesterol oxidase substrate-binding domain-containing protein [Streptomyces sp. SP18CS02]